jgi:hypothetical protein
MVKTGREFVVDLCERTVNSAWQGFVSSFVVLAPTTDWSGAKTVLCSAAGAGISAAGALLKGLVAKDRGVKNSASMSKSI